jgi:hypothetical protein
MVCSAIDRQVRSFDAQPQAPAWATLNRRLRLGFDEYCLFGWHEGPRYYQPLIWQNGEIRRDVEDRYGLDVDCDYLIDFMTRNQDRPFFAFYSMVLCHDVTDDDGTRNVAESARRFGDSDSGLGWRDVVGPSLRD